MEAALCNLSRADSDLCQEDDADCSELCWASSKTWPEAAWFVVLLSDQSERFQRREAKPPVPSSTPYLSWAQPHCVSAGDGTFWCPTDIMWWAVCACLCVFWPGSNWRKPNMWMCVWLCVLSRMLAGSGRATYEGSWEKMRWREQAMMQPF